MKDTDKTMEQLIEELTELRRQVSEFQDREKPHHETTFQDISDSNRLEEILRASEGRLQSILKHAPAAISVKDLDGYYYNVNQVFEDYFGLAKEDIIGKTDFDLLPKEMAEKYRNEDLEIMETGKSLNREDKLLWKGNYRYFSLSKFPLLDGNGRPAGTGIFSIETTKQKQAEEALRSSEVQYQDLFNGMREGFALCKIICDKNGSPEDYRFLTTNPAFSEQTGIEPEHSIGKTVKELFPDIEQSWIDRYGAVAISQEPDSWTDYNHNTDRYYDVSAFSPSDGRFAMLFRDVTEHKQLEERLRQAEKMEAIGQLAGGIAHDYNNQLTGILGYADLLARKLENKTFRGYAEKIMKSARHSANLTCQLLAFARIGKFETIPTDIHKIIGDVVSLLQHSIDKHIRIIQLLKANPSITLGDPTQLQSALLNLALNAVDAMPDGGDLTFSSDVMVLEEVFCNQALFSPVPGRYLKVVIADTGCGMTEETRKSMFEPFFTTKDIGKGTGMGLAGVYGAVERHRGTMAVETELGKGSAFTVYLRLDESKENRSTSAIRRDPRRRTARVLVVDDEESVRGVATDMLEELDCEVITARGGKEAVEYYETSWAHVDLVLLDVMMPEMGGRDTFIAMQRINPDIRSILFSGYDLTNEVKEILEAGVVAFMQKPFRLEELSEKIAHVLPEINSPKNDSTSES